MWNNLNIFCVVICLCCGCFYSQCRCWNPWGSKSSWRAPAAGHQVCAQPAKLLWIRYATVVIFASCVGMLQNGDYVSCVKTKQPITRRRFAHQELWRLQVQFSFFLPSIYKPIPYKIAPHHHQQAQDMLLLRMAFGCKRWELMAKNVFFFPLLDYCYCHIKWYIISCFLTKKSIFSRKSSNWNCPDLPKKKTTQKNPKNQTIESVV